MTDLIYGLELFGIVVFALSGALAAARKNMDIFGFLVVGMASAVGGGTVRDLMLGTTPVFWVTDPNNLYACFAVSAVTYFWAHKVQSRFRLLVWADGFGLALFAIIGTQAAINAGATPFIAIMMGAVTATAGGIVRDILCAEVPLILRREIYALAALIGSAVYWAALTWGLTQTIAVVASFGITLSVRGAAIAFGWSLPVYSRDK